MRAPVAFAVVVCLASSLTLGCSGDTDSRSSRVLFPSGPSPQPPAPSVPALLPAPQEITLGEVVEGRIRDNDPACGSIGGACRQFALTSPRSGTLVVQLSWDPYLTGTLLMLTLDNVAFKMEERPWAPVVGRLRVAAGQRYHLSVIVDVSEGFSDDPFTLTTALE